MEWCPNIQFSKAWRDMESCKYEQWYLFIGVKECKYFWFSGVCWEVKIYKGERNRFSAISAIMFLLYLCFDIHLFARSKYHLNCLSMTAEYSFFEILLYCHNETPMLVYSCCGPKANLLDLMRCFKHGKSYKDFGQAGWKNICQ